MKLLLIVLVTFGFVSCDKDNLTPSGCNFKFKGRDYISTTSDCTDDILVSEGDVFSVYISLPNKSLQLEYQNGPFITENASLKKEGKTISFNTTVKSNNSGEVEPIVGRCSCSF